MRLVAQIGAAIGRQFPYVLLRAVCDLPEDELRASLARLVASELVFQRGSLSEAVHTFKHALVQDPAHGSLLRSTRQQLHAQIAEALEAHSPELMAAAAHGLRGRALGRPDLARIARVERVRNLPMLLIVTMTDIRGSVTAACTLPSRAELLSPLPDTTRTNSVCPDEPLRFFVGVERSTIAWLCALRLIPPNAANDLAAILTALKRIGLAPSISCRR